MRNASTRLGVWPGFLLFTFSLGLSMMLAAYGLQVYIGRGQYDSVKAFDQNIRNATNNPETVRMLSVWSRLDEYQDRIAPLVRESVKAEGEEKAQLEAEIAKLNEEREGLLKQLRGFDDGGRMSDQYFRAREAVVIEAMAATSKKLRAVNFMNVLGIVFLALGGGGFAYLRIRGVLWHKRGESPESKGNFPENQSQLDKKRPLT